jgi:ribosomal protein S18 acetylase RimI-like enzyme
MVAMNIQSLAYRTDLIFPRFDGVVIDRGAYTVIRTPANPGFYWGNFLLFAEPPASGDLSRWRAIFGEEIGAHYDARHYAFGWDSPAGETGAVQPFLDAGYDMHQLSVLTAQRVDDPPKHNAEIAIRPLQEDWEWAEATETQFLCLDPVYKTDEASARRFKERQMARYRAMAAAGLGNWYGAFLGKQLVGDLGLYFDKEVGRFQNVETHPAFRRRGVCSTLVHQVALAALSEGPAQTLVMVADEHYHAAKIYESLGFRPTERQIGISWWEGKAS